MEQSKVFYYIKKLLPIILIVCILATVGVNLSLTNQRRYTASAVINYDYQDADKGLTPSGEVLDTSEIKSSAIMSKVIDSLGLTGVYSVDNLTSRISITEVPDPDKQSAKDAALEKGEDYTYVPTTYIVSFTATNNEGGDFARSILDETLDYYFQEFGENYVNVDHISNKLDKLYDGNYDYIDMVEYIDSCIDDTVNVLYNREAASPYYRSTETAKSFNDLIDDFTYIDSVKISDLFSRIFKYQVTKSKPILTTTYNTRKDNNDITTKNKQLLVANIETIIANYVEKMQESGNTDITYEYILDQVYDKDTTDYNGNPVEVDQTVTYDDLIYAWRNFKIDDKLAVIDSAYCDYVLTTFNSCQGTCGDTCATSDKTCAQISNSDYAKIEEEINQDISEVVDELTELYNIAIATSDEYNQYLGCDYISVLSTASTGVSVNVGLYTVIAFIFFMVICCGGAILVGRMNDIILKSFYTDPITGFRNRAYFDKYLKKQGRHNLDDGTVIVSCAITNQSEINESCGRDVGDEVLKLFAEELKLSFAKMKAMYVYNGNAHFVVLIEKSDAITAEDALQVFSLAIDDRDKCEQASINYKLGVAESFRDRLSSARKLLVESIKNYKDQTSSAHKEKVEE